MPDEQFWDIPAFGVQTSVTRTESSAAEYATPTPTLSIDGGKPILACGVWRLLATAWPRRQADSDATGPSPGEAARACAARPRVLWDRRPPTDQTPRRPPATPAATACQLACVAARAAGTRWSFASSLASASCSRRFSDNIRMRLWKSAFDCSSSRSFSAARSGSFQTIGVVDQKAVRRRPPANKCWPSGENASDCTLTQLDAAGIQLHQLAPRLDIPEADRLVSAARRQGATIRRKHHGRDRTGMPLERFQKFSGGDVPQLHGPLTTGQGQGLAVRRKGHILDHAPSRMTRVQRGSDRDSGACASLSRSRSTRGSPSRRGCRWPAAIRPARSREKHSSSCVHSGGGSVGAWRPPRPSAERENSQSDSEVFEPNPATRYFPSGENASAPTAPLVSSTLKFGQIGRSRQPRQLRSGIDVPERDIRNVGLSRRTRQPAGGCRSGENATLETRPLLVRATVPARVAPWRRPTAAHCCRWPRRSVGHPAKSASRAVELSERPSSGRMAAPAFSRSQTLAVLSALVADEPLAIAREADGVDRPLMALERHERRALRVQLPRIGPDLDRPLGIRRGQPGAVAGEGHRRDGRRVSGTDAVRSSGLWLCRKPPRLPPAARRQRAVGHPESTRRHATLPRKPNVLSPAESLSSRPHPGGRSKSDRRGNRGRRRPASDHRQTRRDFRCGCSF